LYTATISQTKTQTRKDAVMNISLKTKWAIYFISALIVIILLGCFHSQWAEWYSTLTPKQSLGVCSSMFFSVIGSLLLVSLSNAVCRVRSIIFGTGTIFGILVGLGFSVILAIESTNFFGEFARNHFFVTWNIVYFFVFFFLLLRREGREQSRSS